MNALTNGFTIIAPNGNKYHSLEDFGLAIGNTNPIGEPEQEEFTVDVPGGPVLDLSEVLTGRPVFKTRQIHIEVGGIRGRFLWDSVMSELRNKFEGKTCKIIFDNDYEWYWEGRVKLTGFEREVSLGKFNFDMPQASAYKYAVIPYERSYDEETAVIEFPEYDIPVSPTFICTSACQISNGTETYNLSIGENRIPNLKTDTDKTWTLTDNDTTTVICREMSL